MFRYVKTWFTLDVISSLPISNIVLACWGKNEHVYMGLKGASRALKFLKIVKLLNLLKLLRLSRIIRGISQHENVRFVRITTIMGDGVLHSFEGSDTVEFQTVHNFLNP